MAFNPKPNQQLTIGDCTYIIAEHPAAPGMPYGQEGRAAVVYQLIASAEKRALKVFKSRFRTPSLVSLSRRLEAFASLPGLQVCSRAVLTPQQEPDLLAGHPDLLYAVVMPWIEGPTWMEVVQEGQALSERQCLTLSRALAGVLANMEQEGLAHCDLSGPNLLLPLLADDPSGALAGDSPSAVELVDVEQLYGPEMRRPEVLASGSQGYAHRGAGEGLWSIDADRFAGGVLLAEMLGWCDRRVRDEAWGESYFEPGEMQQETRRYTLLNTCLEERWGGGAAHLFRKTWWSEELKDCPTFSEWLLALPGAGARSTDAPGDTPLIRNAPDGDARVAELMEQAQQFEITGRAAEALATYREALAHAPAGSALAQELTLIVAGLQRSLEPTLAQATIGGELPRFQPKMIPVEMPSGYAVVPSSATSTGGGDAEVSDLFDQGLLEYKRGEWSKARELLAEVQRRRPGYERGGEEAAALLAQISRHERQKDAPRRAGRWRVWLLIPAVMLLVVAGGTLGVYFTNAAQEGERVSAAATATVGAARTAQVAAQATQTAVTSIGQVATHIVGTQSAVAQATGTAEAASQATDTARGRATAQAVETINAQARQAQATLTAIQDAQNANATQTAQALSAQATVEAIQTSTAQQAALATQQAVQATQQAESAIATAEAAMHPQMWVSVGNVAANDWLNIRSGPGTSLPLLGGASRGQPLWLNQGPQSGDGTRWWNVQWKAQGWCNGKYLLPTAPALGDTVKVTGAQKLAIHSDYDAGSKMLGVVVEGSQYEVIDGPRKARTGNDMWYKLDIEVDGWSVEQLSGKWFLQK